MNTLIFTVFDSKAEAFLNPFYSNAVGLALRSFEAACNDATHDFHKYAADYTLFQLGTFNQESGTFDLLASPLNLGLAITFINQADTPPLLKEA